ncbi:MAG TPA: OmpH family outer membrane protein [Pirellulales bacterium]|nr:OmpH family outer membrane protein [Pirellulales bacterium]
MRRNILWIVLLLTIAVASDPWNRLLRTSADDGAAPPAAPPTRVAMLDLARIFSNYDKFKRQSDELRREVEQAERQLKTRKAELQAAADSLGTLPKESSQAKKLQEQIAHDTAEITAHVAEQKRHFFEKEAAIYYECYREVMAEVERYAKERGINLVMRFNGDPFDPADPQAIQKELNKAVLYQDGIDITDEILHSVN